LKRFIALVIAIVMIMQGVVIVSAAPNKLNNLKNKNKDINNQIAQTRKEKALAKQKHDQIAKQIAMLDQQMNNANDSLNKVESNLDRLEKQIAVTTIELQRAQRDANSQNGVLRKRLRAMYENGFQGYLSVVLSSTSYSDFITRLNYLTKIVKYDNEILIKMEKYSAAVADKQLKLKNDMIEKERIKADHNEKKQQVAVATNNKHKYMDEVNKDIKELEAQEDELQAQAKALAKEIAKLLSAGKYTGGVMTWPLPGHYSISSGYGYRIHPIYKTKRMHDGIDIPAPAGTNIIAAAGGKVIASSYKNAVGNYVTIDHGGKITSNYYHASQRLVKAGDIVRKGQVIARVGSTGASTGNHLHFEVRINSSSVNPFRYLKN